VREEPAQQGTPEEAGGELATTGFNVAPLAVIGALCVAASIVLFRRRKTI
jgi:LPXTG-motif cell wall-anchored protein